MEKLDEDEDEDGEGKEGEPGWDILREDYLTGKTKMKEWEKRGGERAIEMENEMEREPQFGLDDDDDDDGY